METILETPEFVAVNKPSGLLSISDREGKEQSLKELLDRKFGKVFTVHRLDKGTSGVIVFAKTPEAHRALSALFESRETEKVYHGLVEGKPAVLSGSIDAPIMQAGEKKTLMIIHQKGKPSLTDYEVQESFGNFSWMRFRIHTGRTHQIRVHMKHLGTPIVADDLYGSGKPLLLSSIKRNYHLSKKDEEERPLLSRLALHASSLDFTLNGTGYRLEAPLPKDLRATLAQLRKIAQ